MRIILDDDNPHLISRLIEYCYLRDFTEEKYDNREEPDFVSGAHIDAQMYALGDKYDIRGLKALAAEKIEPAFDAYTLNTFGLDIQFLKEVSAVVDVVYSSTPESDRRLRDITMQVVLDLWEGLSAMDELKTVLCSHSDLILDMVEAAWND